MAERDRMLIALVKEVLGPREGPNELMASEPEELDPRTEYITGVLEPENVSSVDERIEDEVEEVIEETSSEEDQDTQGFVSSPGVFSPALDQKALPRSIGISFTLTRDQGQPEIEICCTWARYYQEGNGWRRHPSCYLSGALAVNHDYPNVSAGLGVRLYLRSRPLSEGVWRILVFLVNVTEVPAGERPDTGDYVFQPQIRVHVCDGTTLVPVHLDESDSPEQPDENQREDLSLALLYHHRTALARGHMCGAIWKDIDPERPFGDNHPAEAPYRWTDAETVPETERDKFTPADVRTEIVPVYLIQTPEMAWLADYGPAPEFSPEILSEAWQPEQLRQALLPLVNGYQTWLHEQQDMASSLAAIYQPAAQAHLQDCYQAASRMQEAIDVLCMDADVRLAFCFANKAIDLQSRWKNQAQPLQWRPFQLAFILLNIPPLARPNHPDRNVCDLLWFPTGGGKTEAYLGLAAFVLGLRRLRARNNDPSVDCSGAGTAVLSRYTLRLLTIQQFRRALGVITACELLRVQNLGGSGPEGWRPRSCERTVRFLWGGIRFSAGLWVGGGVTPNNNLSMMVRTPNGSMMLYAGALDILQGIRRGYDGANAAIAEKVMAATNNVEIEGEPAQVTQCPCCKTTLAVPSGHGDDGLVAGQHTLHFVYHGGNSTTPPLPLLRPHVTGASIDSVRVRNHSSPGYRTLSVTFNIPERARFTAEMVDEWWEQTIRPALGNQVVLSPARPARPGYFLTRYQTSQNSSKECDFEIFCPNPECELNQHVWVEQVPLARERTGTGSTNAGQMMLGLSAADQNDGLPTVFTDSLEWQDVPAPFRLNAARKRSTRIPIPALTVDDQVYQRCPSLVIATVDKFTRLAFEPRAASLFGNVTHYHARWGYYRAGSPPNDGSNVTTPRDHPAGLGRNNPLNREIPPFGPPELILQDELHLIEGPLGSMVGLYETAIDLLSQRTENGQTIIPKYIASTATVRQAEAQVQSLFNRRLLQFPPSAISADERFFATSFESHPLDNSRPGRLYAAICAPGKGAQTPIVRIWSTLLQTASDLRATASDSAIDPFWTLIGYFNATRELAGALSLYRQDIPERMGFRAGNQVRLLDDNRRLELSSRASSMNLPILLQKLEVGLPLAAQDAAFATSMFGTGVDIDRLSLMVVHGQPKTTASYIQATGRVGRQTSGLVVSFFRASRPRDLDHYEFFTGYHRALYRYVEPVTVAPFSPRARERSLGPLAVVLLRQARLLDNQPVNADWKVQQRIGSNFYSLANRMANARFSAEVQAIPALFEQRAASQPEGRRPVAGVTEQETNSELDRWRAIAGDHSDPNQLVYNEPAVIRQPQRHVILGDAQHHMRFDEAYENAPQSLRDIEETTGFQA